MLKLNREQAEIIYNSLLLSLRENNIQVEAKHEQLQNEILDRYDVTDILDQLDHFYDFIVEENGFEFDDEE